MKYCKEDTEIYVYKTIITLITPLIIQNRTLKY